MEDGGSGAVVRTLRWQDTAVTARIHAQALPEGFFARLGPGFLSTYHRSYIDSPHALALASGSGDQVAAFLLAVLAPRAHGAYVLRSFGVRLALRGVVGLLRRPGLLVEFVRTRLARYVRGLWRRRRPVEPSRQRAQGTWAVLSHIAVDADSRGAGHGAALVRELEEHARRANAPGLILLTAQDGPGAAFYTRLGYVDEGTVRGADGLSWRRFRRSLRGG